MSVEVFIEKECACYINDHRPCSWGLIRSLWGLIRIPVSYRNKEIQKAIDSGIIFVLEKYSFVEANFPMEDGEKIHPLWSKMKLPAFLSE